MLPATGSTITAAMRSPLTPEQRLDGVEVVEGARSSVSAAQRGGHARAVGDAERGAAGAGLDQQAVGVAVVAAVELHDDVAPGRAARHAGSRSSPPRCPS